MYVPTYGSNRVSIIQYKNSTLEILLIVRYRFVVPSKQIRPRTDNRGRGKLFASRFESLGTGAGGDGLSGRVVPGLIPSQ